jgi:hypothetical protein
VICFIHIPKTAGTYVKELFRINGYKTKTSIEIDFYEKKKLNLSNDINFISGHLNYFNFKNISRKSKKNFKYFTLIRNPIERIFSIINYTYQNCAIYLDNRSFKGIFNIIDYKYNFIRYFNQYFFLSNQPTSILKNPFLYKHSFNPIYNYFFEKPSIDFEKADIIILNIYCEKIKLLFKKNEINFFDSNDLSLLKKNFNLKSDLNNKVNTSVNFLDYDKIDKEKFFNISFKYIYSELIFYYYFLNKNVNLVFKNKNDLKNFFWEFFLYIYPKLKPKTFNFEKLELIKKNFENIVIRDSTKSEHKLYQSYGSINKIDEKKIEFNKSKGVPVDFDEVIYYKINEDVYKDNVDAYDHYLKYGRQENRLYSNHDYIYIEKEKIIFERFINI